MSTVQTGCGGVATTPGSEAASVTVQPTRWGASPRGKVVIVGVQSHIWDARTSLRPEDLELSAEQLPEKAVAGLGSKYTFDRSRLRPLLASRLALYRTLKERGVSIGNAYVIAEDEYKEAMAKAGEIIADFEKAKRELVTKAPEWYEEWKENIPPKFHPTDGAERVVQEVERSFLATIEFEVSELSQKASNQLSERLLQEVVSGAQDMLRGSFHRYKNRLEATQRILLPLKKLKNKIESMVFVDHETWQPILDEITALLDSVPSKGKLNHKHLSQLYVLLVALVGMRDKSIRDSLKDAESSGDLWNVTDDTIEDSPEPADSAPVNAPASGWY